MTTLATVLTATSSNWFWYFGRATGFVALILLTAILVLGITGRLRIASDRWPRFATAQLHRDLALLSVVVIAVHVAASMLDQWVHIPLSAAVIPFTSSYKPLLVGLGTTALDLMLALIVTSLLRHRLGLATWRNIHWLAYASWPIALLHGVSVGSDAGKPWGIAISASCVLVVAVALSARVTFAPPADRTPNLAGQVRGAGPSRSSLLAWQAASRSPSSARPSGAARTSGAARPAGAARPSGPLRATAGRHRDAAQYGDSQRVDPPGARSRR
ncbi:MAG: ferric reductase-like transmembrane domain-containing protein [Solirubrobacteraceae bacterium]